MIYVFVMFSLEHYLWTIIFAIQYSIFVCLSYL